MAKSWPRTTRNSTQIGQILAENNQEFDQILDLVEFGQILDLAEIYQIRFKSNLVNFGQNRPKLVDFGPKWPEIEPFWPEMDPNWPILGPIWPKMGH